MNDKRQWYKRPLIIVLLSVLFILALPALFVTVGIIRLVVELNGPTHYVKGSDFPFDDLPPSASDVRFAPSGPFAPMGRTYEFRCTADDYRDWVEQTRRAHPKLGEIQTQDSGQHPAIDSSGKVDFVLLRDYLVSEWRFEDEGFHLVYDPATQRAIRWSHSR